MANEEKQSPLEFYRQAYADSFARVERLEDEITRLREESARHTEARGMLQAELTKEQQRNMWNAIDKRPVVLSIGICYLGNPVVRLMLHDRRNFEVMTDTRTFARLAAEHIPVYNETKKG